MPRDYFEPYNIEFAGEVLENLAYISECWFGLEDLEGTADIAIQKVAEELRAERGDE